MSKDRASRGSPQWPLDEARVNREIFRNVGRRNTHRQIRTQTRAICSTCDRGAAYFKNQIDTIVACQISNEHFRWLSSHFFRWRCALYLAFSMFFSQRACGTLVAQQPAHENSRRSDDRAPWFPSASRRSTDAAESAGIFHSESSNGIRQHRSSGVDADGSRASRPTRRFHGRRLC